MEAPYFPVTFVWFERYHNLNATFKQKLKIFVTFDTIDILRFMMFKIKKLKWQSDKNWKNNLDLNVNVAMLRKRNL